jgi:hypothetical protein
MCDRLSATWFKRNGGLELRVSRDDGLLLRHPREGSFPLHVWHDLCQSSLVYFYEMQGERYPMTNCRQPLHAWLEGGPTARSLACVHPKGLDVPVFARWAMVAVVEFGLSQVLCVSYC